MVSSGDAAPCLHNTMPMLRVFLVHLLQQVLDDLLFMVVGRRSIDPAVAIFELVALVDQQGDIATIVDHHFRSLALTVIQGLGRAPPVVFQRLALPGEDRNAGCRNGRCCVVLGGEDVAASPANVRAERNQGLDQNRGLDGHVQRAGDAYARQGLLCRVLVADGHQAGHLVLSDRNLFTSPVSQGEVGHLVICGGAGNRCCCHILSSPHIDTSEYVDTIAPNGYRVNRKISSCAGRW